MSDFWEKCFGADDYDDFPADRDDLDDAIEEAKPFVYPTRAELWEQLHHANATAKRLHGTVYYERAHAFINGIIWDIEEQRGR